MKRLLFPLLIVVSLLSVAVQAEELTPDQRRRAERLLAGLDRYSLRFPTDEDHDPLNGPVFVYLARTSQDPVVITAALRAADTIYVAKGGHVEARANGKTYKRVFMDEAYMQAVLRNLSSKDEKVLRAAIGASDFTMWGASPDLRVRDKLLEVLRTSDNPEVRREAIMAFWVYRRSDPLVGKAYLASLDSEFAAELHDALQAIRSAADHKLDYGADFRQQARKKCRELARFRAEIVRGDALQALVALADPSEKAALARELEAWLKDPSPHVVSKAARAIGELQQPSSLPRLMELLDDARDNRVRLQISEQTASIEAASNGGQVNDAVLYALQECSHPLWRRSIEAFEYKPGSTPQDIAREASRARKWWSQVRPLVQGRP